MAIAYHPKFEYVGGGGGGRRLHRRGGSAEGDGGEAAAGREYQTLATFPGAQLEGAVFRHPFLERDSLGHPGRPRHARTGHRRGPHRSRTRPGRLRRSAQQYGIATYCPVDAAGRFFHAEGAAGQLPEELIGKTVWEANPIVIEILQAARRAAGAWRKSSTRYPHCWRCHNPIIFRATEQWFIGMERNDFRAGRARGDQAR